MNRNRRFNLLIILLKIYSGLVIILGIGIIFLRNHGLIDRVDQVIGLDNLFQLEYASRDIKSIFYYLVGILVLIIGLLLMMIISNSLEKKLIWPWQTLLFVFILLIISSIYFSIIYNLMLYLIISMVSYGLFVVMLVLIKGDCIKRL